MNSENMRQGYWKDEGRNVRLRGSELQRYLEKFPELKESKFEHKKEQLFLALAQGMPEEWIDHLFADNLCSSVCIDFQRTLLLLSGDFDFVRERCTGRFCYDEIVEEYLDREIRKRYPVIEEIQKLKEEKERLTMEFKDKVEFLLKKFNYEQQISELNEQHKAELLLKDFEKKEQAFMFERRSYEEKLGRLKKERDRLKVEALEMRQGQELPEKAVKKPFLEEEKEKEKAAVSERHIRMRIRKFFSKGKEVERSNDREACRLIFMEAMQKNTYSNKHLQILSYAFTNGFSAEEMGYLINPEMETDNAVVLCSLFAGRRKLECPFTIAKQEEEDMQERVPGDVKTDERTEQMVQDEITAESDTYTDDEMQYDQADADEMFEDAP